MCVPQKGQNFAVDFIFLPQDGHVSPERFRKAVCPKTDAVRSSCFSPIIRLIFALISEVFLQTRIFMMANS